MRWFWQPKPIGPSLPPPGPCSHPSGQDFATLALEIAKPEYDGLSDEEVAARLKAKVVTVPYVQTLGFDPDKFWAGQVLHARRGGGI